MEIVNEIVMMPIDSIIPYEKNPRKNSKTVKLLCEIIPKVGFNVPLVLDEHNVIVKGHARWLAAKRLGMQTVPCVVSHADADSIKADRIADNRVFEFSQWVNEELMHEIDMLDLDFDPEMFGLPKLEIGDELGFSFDEPEDDSVVMSDEERRRRFEEFMAKSEEGAQPVEFVTLNQMSSAKQAQRAEAKAPPTYYTVTCEKCGATMFIREGDEMVWE